MPNFRLLLADFLPNKVGIVQEFDSGFGFKFDFTFRIDNINKVGII